MTTRSEYLRHVCLLLVATSVASIPSSYLSSMTGGNSGMTWMGWAPQTGMTAFASSSNPWNAERGWKNPGVELDPPTQETSSSQQEEQEQDEPPKKWNKPRYDEDDNKPGSSKAEASLNAWFPIMLGLFPPQGENGRNQQPEQGWENAKSIAAVANSVNHGSRGVASSHAVAFGGEPPNYRSRTYNRNVDSKEKTPQAPPQTAQAPQDQYGAAAAQPQPKPQPYYKPLQRYANTAY